MGIEIGKIQCVNSSHGESTVRGKTMSVPTSILSTLGVGKIAETYPLT